MAFSRIPYIKMHRWAAGHLSDAPELTPLTPLGDFVTQPGKPPAEEVTMFYDYNPLTIYYKQKEECTRCFLLVLEHTCSTWG